MARSRVTVKDVAKKANVSASTVSRVISDNPRISKETKNRVLKVMDELDFHPNAIARNLAKSTSSVLGVIIPFRNTDTLLNPFFPEALRGIIKSAKKNGYDVLLSSSANINEELENIKTLFQARKVDGVILMSSRKDDENINFLSKKNYPFTVIGSVKDRKDIPFVDNDNRLASYELTKLLIDSGKKNILFASGEFRLTVTENRAEGFKDALKEANLSFSDENFLVGSFDEETGSRFANELIKKGKKIDGIVATDDVIAYGLVKTLREAGIKIPEEISVASFNNSLLSRYFGITSVDVNAYELGKGAVEQLVEILKDEDDIKVVNKFIDFKIVERDSTNI